MNPTKTLGENGVGTRMEVHVIPRLKGGGKKKEDMLGNWPA
ncbi:MAG: hypothetical protein QGH82_03480 [Candidatus Woesearchaeota archaeon]|nr:hypothetical protein [Candidatus Woesearchaeota archaeon]